VKQEPEMEGLDLTEFDTPEEALFNCLLVVARLHEVCVLCLLKSFNEDIAQMIQDKALAHGEDPRKTLMQAAGKTLQ